MRRHVEKVRKDGACAAVGSGSRDLGEPALSPPPGGASELLLNLLAAAERPWLRQWLAVAAWWKL
jgi:hypothetical protein